MISLHGTVITLTWSLCTIQTSLSRGLIACYGYLSRVVSLHGTVIALTWSHCMMMLLSIISSSRGLIAWYGYRSHVTALHGTLIAFARYVYRSHVVQRPIKMEKIAELRELGLFPLMATCTHAKTPTMLAGISLDKQTESSMYNSDGRQCPPGCA